MKKECLLIDDDQDDQEIFKMCLRRLSQDINCRVMNDGAEAYLTLSTSDYTPDFIFLDVNMPKMNGIDCLGVLRKIERLRQTKIYMYSTSSQPKTVEISKEFGADGFIIKPARTDELKDKLAAILQIVAEINQSGK
jgi:CheY-like chemotaxis protein